MVVEILSPTDCRSRYEILQPPRDWRAMSKPVMAKFGAFKTRWTVELKVEEEFQDRIEVFDITTPCIINEVNQTVKQIIDDLLGKEAKIYGAVVTVTVK